jgi:hypothetical protein
VTDILNQLKRPILMAWLTTCGVFVILLSSSVSSHRQMALLAIGGITFAVLISWLLIPTFTRKRQVSDSLPADTTHSDHSPPIWSIPCWLALIVAGLFTWPQLRYNGDLQVLDVTSDAIAKADATFHETWRGNTEQAFILATGKNIAEALNTNDQIFTDLQNKLDQPAYSAAPILPGPLLRADRMVHWQNFWQLHQDTLAEQLNKIGAETGFAADSFTPFLQYTKNPPADMNEQQVLNGVLRPLLASMVRTIPNSADNGDINAVAMTITPLDPKTWSALLDLEQKNDAVFLLSTLKWRQNVEHFLRTDITRLSLIAGIFIIVLTGVFFRNIRQVVAALAPVGAALAAMSIFDYTTGRDLNLMHVLMGLMVIGLSVDYGIFSVCTHQKTVSATTSKAISICAVSSCIGFGVLALASHPALHALGITVLIGIGLAWPTALWVTPAILNLGKNDA